ncbi:MAG: hypothetical protein R2862_05955 [Thermoanaerobaculia bacterium]
MGVALLADGAKWWRSPTGERLHCPSWTTGALVRPEFFEAVAVRSDGKPRLLVLGGSQGSQRINELLLEVLGRLRGAAGGLGAASARARAISTRAGGLRRRRYRVAAVAGGAVRRQHAGRDRCGRPRDLARGAITLAEICAPAARRSSCRWFSPEPTRWRTPGGSRTKGCGRRRGPCSMRSGCCARSRCFSATARDSCTMVRTHVFSRIRAPRRRSSTVSRLVESPSAGDAGSGGLMFHRFAGLRHAHSCIAVPG